MKTRNIFGSDTSGSIGNKITTSHWRGRSYAKAHRSPTNPQSTKQTENRSVFSDGVSEWQSFNNYQKQAYEIYAINRHLTVSGYHAFLGSYVDTRTVGQTYYPPSGGWFRVLGLYSGLPVDGAVIEISRDGRTEIYYSTQSDVSGKAYGGLTVEDQTYTVKIMADGYDTFQQSGYLASQLFGSQSTIYLVGGQIMRFMEDFVWKTEAGFMGQKWSKQVVGVAGQSVVFDAYGIKITTGNMDDNLTRFYTSQNLVDPTVTPLLLGRVFITEIDNMGFNFGMRLSGKNAFFGTSPDQMGTKWGYFTNAEGWVASAIDATIGWHNLIMTIDDNLYPTFKVDDIVIGVSPTQMSNEMYDISYLAITINASGSQVVRLNLVQLFDDGVALIP